MADSIRAALTDAFEKAEKDEAITPSTPDAPAPATEAPAPAATAAEETAPAAETPAAAPAPAASDPAATPQPPVIGAAPDAPKPPASWKPTEKAEWDKVPPTVREAVLRREQETSRALNQSAEARKFVQSFEQAITPFRPLMDAYGVRNPVEAIVPLLQTRAALEVGTPTQKAQLVANLIHQFGVDIATLDNFLANGPQQAAQAPPVQPQQASFDPRTLPELQPLFSLAEQFKSYQAQKAEAEIAKVADLPHFDTVREDMADILERAAAQGKSVSLEVAYRRAVAMNPDLEIPAAAPAQPTAISPSEAAAILARSRKAASSVAGAPKVAPTGKPSSLREQIAAAMEEVG